MTPALQALTFYPQFILYKLVPSRKKPGKMDKYPVNPHTLEVETAHDPAMWVTYDQAVSTASLLSDEYGVAFVFAKSDPFFFLDIDNCIDPTLGTYNDVATNLIAALPGAAVEKSQSGTGLHLFGMSHPFEHGCKNSLYGCELYTEGRFVALTGAETYGDATTDCTQMIPWVVENYFPPVEAQKTEEWRNTPVPEWAGIEDDNELIQAMLKSKSAAAMFGSKASVADLWNADVSRLSIFYPPLNDLDPYDMSSADGALAQHLAFWTGKNHERMLQLMWKSGLVREKWTGHKNYLSITISNAVNNQGDVYQKRTVEERQVTSYENQLAQGVTTQEPATTVRTGVQFMPPSQQEEYFKGCVYIRGQHKVFTPDGSILKPEQFKATYGGYSFSLDSLNEKTTKNAWECFTESHAIDFPWVHHVCFRPELPSGQIVEEEGHKYVNIYVPINTVAIPGDVTPFLNHLSNLMPTQRDLDILLAYMAAVVQYPGKKFHWCPLIQGTEGNGKSVVGTVLSYCAGRRYTHKPNASDLSGNGFKFNSWITGKLLIIIEEIYVSDKKEITEPLKVIVSDERLEIQGKGTDQYTGDNRANFVLFSNHKDAIRVKIDTRRYCVIYTSQQSYADMQRDGMTGDYFPNLFNWLEAGGFAAVNNYLREYQIPDELNPSTHCQRAPKNDSFNEAVALSVGGIESEIMEAVDEGKQGFIYPWVSSMALDKLLKDRGQHRMVPPNKRRELMQSLGYDYHEGLLQGRLNAVVQFEGGKPKLYVHRDSTERNIMSAAAVHEEYCKSQGYQSVAFNGQGNAVPVPTPQQ